jgi:hypothetical protein
MERLKSLGLGLVCLGLAALFGWLLASDLIQDIRHRNDTLAEAQDIRLVSGKCKTRLFVMSICDLKMRRSSPSTEIEQTYFLLGNYGGSTVSILRSQQDPSYITTSMGREQFWNRLILAILPIGLFALGGVKLLFSGLIGPKTART